MNKLGNNFMNDESINKTYNQWIHSPTLFQHWLDRDRFYRFVKACVLYVKEIRFVKKEVAWRELKIELLEKRLEVDFAELKKNNFHHYEKVTLEIVSNFEFLIEWEKFKSA